MTDWNNQKFQMPMFNAWVPEAMRPWIYVLFASLFQLSGGVYFANIQHMVGASSLMREDLQMIAMFGVVGVNMPFPFLFRYKLRFTNKQLLINAALVIAACNLVCLWLLQPRLSFFNIQLSIIEDLRVPLLCLVSFVAGYFKLCGTFECFSNIRLWLSPKQDFGIFLPSMYIIILAAAPASNWAALQLAEYVGSWQLMHWLMVGLMLWVVLVQVVMCHGFRFMKPLPLVSLDYLGMLLWSAVMLEVIWLFTYGEYYNWWQSTLWQKVLIALPATLAMAVHRMRRVRHPYIDKLVFGSWRLVPILGMFFVAEVMNATPHALQNTLTGGVLHFGWTTTADLYLFEVVGSAWGCVFTILWAGGSVNLGSQATPRWGPLPRLGLKYTRLLTVGFAALLLYQVMMYFCVSPVLNIERLWLPTVLRTFGYAIFFSTMTLYLKDLIEFPTFFHALTVSGFIRNGVGESVCSGFYSFGLRRQIADTLSNGQFRGDMSQVLMIAVKQMYGLMCVVGLITLLLMLLYDVQPVRSTMRRMQPMQFIMRTLGRQLRHDAKMRRLAEQGS